MAVQLQNLRKTYGDFTALEGFDLTLEPGELVSLVGPSGCGKTTALRIVAGFERPTAGSVVVDGRDVTNVPPNKRDMGMVFQAYSLFPNMTAAGNVEFGLRVRGLSGERRKSRVAELLEVVGLTEARGRYPHQLSGGMQQRVAIARALAIQPRMLLLDEPLSALDAKVRLGLREEIRRLQKDLGITTLFVTHDQEEAMAISDRVTVLSKGRVEQIGTPAEIYGEPQTPFVAEFIGTMNRLEAEVLDDALVAIGHDGSSPPRFEVEAARGHAPGERVMVLVRPESIDLWPLPDGAPVPEGSLTGTVVSHAFLGPISRVKVASDGQEITADLPSRAALGVGLGDKVAARFDPRSPRILPLDGEASRGEGLKQPQPAPPR